MMRSGGDARWHAGCRGKTPIAARLTCDNIVYLSDKFGAGRHRPLMPMQVTQIDRPARLSDRVSREMEAWIRELGLAPGVQLPTEKELCERFGVSRAVIREAISRLKAEGCVETRQGLGAFVAALPGEGSFRLDLDIDPDGTEAEDVFELRCIVESAAAELAARRCGPQGLARIAAALAQMEEALLTNDGGAAADDAFHQAIAAASGNRQLERFLAYMGRQFSASRLPTWDDAGHRSGRAAQSQAEHRQIFDAIRRGDAAAAGRASRAHLEAASQRLGIRPRARQDHVIQPLAGETWGDRA